ncbi:MAG: hypothetical protein GY757_00595, partial [bacterium]|nr:hypothetical protein [bacterium]
HNIVCDGVSREILTGEITADYTGEQLPPLRVQYKDYAVWLNNTAQQQDIKGQEAYWLKTLAGQLPVLELPQDNPRPLVQSFEGDTIEFTVAKEEMQKIKAAADENNATLYMTIMAVYTIMLSKLSRQEDIIVGAPIAGRRHADLENIIGMFVNTLPMRNYPEEEKTFTAYLKEVKERTLTAYENQEYPFEDLVEKLALPRDTGRNSIFDVAFNMLAPAGTEGAEKPATIWNENEAPQLE